MKTKTKYKAKSKIKKISYIVITICVLCISIIPCYAVQGTYANARSFESVPILFENVIIAYYYDEETGFDFFNTSNSWGASIAFGYDFEMHQDGGTYTEITSSYYGETQDSDIFTIKDSFDYDQPGYTCTGLDAIYTINSGNYLINTAEDEFNFYISPNAECEYSIACSYTILNAEIENYEPMQYFAIYGTTANGDIEFNLCNQISTSLGYDAEVIINALTIEWATIDLITNYFTSNVRWNQSESVSERNTNAASINYNGTVNNEELNYYNTIDEKFGNMGIERYKSSFINYTADYTSWIGEAVGGFLNMEIFPYFSIGGILLICVALGLVGYFLKVFLGG